MGSTERVSRDLRTFRKGSLLGSSLLAVALLCPTSSAGQPCPTPLQLQSDLEAAAQAEIINLSGVNPLTCPSIQMAETWLGGRLIFSNSPESPTAPGKLYEDTTLEATSGTDYNRVFLYHVNGNTSDRMKFTVLIKNLGCLSARLRVERKGTAGPTTNYAFGGKVAFFRWFNSESGEEAEIAPGETARLDTLFDTTPAQATFLMHGIWDYSFMQPHQITICALDPEEDPLSVCPGLDLLGRDTHTRGTFPNAEKIYGPATGTVIDTSDGIQQFAIAQQGPDETFATGTDATDGNQVTNVGNYGILYHIQLDTVSSDGGNLGFLLNPRGGVWAGSVNAIPGITPGGSFLIPDGAILLGDNTRAALAGKYSPGEGLATWLEFMPTGGSAFPLRFVVVPHEMRSAPPSSTGRELPTHRR